MHQCEHLNFAYNLQHNDHEHVRGVSTFIAKNFISRYLISTVIRHPKASAHSCLNLRAFLNATFTER